MMWPRSGRIVGEIHDRNPGLRLSKGKKILELQPDIDWDKGKALRWLRQAADIDPARVVPIYIGDDTTDEDAFRGAAPESVADQVHDPGSYIASCYNRLQTEIAGRTVADESLVNALTWLVLTFRIEDGDWFDLRAVDLLSYRQELDLKHATRVLRYRELNADHLLQLSAASVPVADIQGGTSPEGLKSLTLNNRYRQHGLGLHVK